MTGRRRTALLSIGLLAGIICALPARAGAPDPALGTFIPGDVWVYIHKVNTPSRDFVRAHWGSVLRALKTCGIGEEVERLVVRHLDGEQKASFERAWQTSAELLDRVHWSDLVAQEVAVAERFGGLLPEIIFLCRPAKETFETNVAGLRRAFETLADLDEGILFSESTMGGVVVSALELETAPMGLYMLRKDGVLAFVLGRAAMEDVAALLDGGAAPSIDTDQRFHAALAQVPAPGFALVYFDLQRLFRALPKLPDMLFGVEDDERTVALKKIMRTVIAHLDIFDYAIFTSRMDGLKEYTHGYTKLKAGCERKPLYRMLAHRRAVPDFHRYVPAEAKAFAVSSSIDLDVLYETILETIRADLPDGPRLCEEWASFQRRCGFDLEDDFLSWFSGELISVTMAPERPLPARTEDSVMLLRVKDSAKAKAKIKAALDGGAAKLSEYGQPLLVTDAKAIPAEGFRCVSHPALAIMMMTPCLGVWEDWIVLGTSESAIRKVMETAAGKRPPITDSARFKAEGIHPHGPVYGATFTDLRGLGQELSMAFVLAGFVAAGQATHQEQAPGALQAATNVVGKLVPVVAEINFFSSMSSVSTFKNNAWRSTMVTTYKPLKPGAPAPPE